MKHVILGLGLAIGMTTGAAFANEQVAPVQQHNTNAVWFENWIGLSNATMNVNMPSGEQIKIFAASGTPVFRLEGNEVADGVYSYELSAATEDVVQIVNKINNGRGENGKDSHAGSFVTNGHFTVYRGVIVTPEDIKEE